MEQPPGEQCEKRIGDSSDPTIPEWVGVGIDSGGHNECDERIKPQRLYQANHGKPERDNEPVPHEHDGCSTEHRQHHGQNELQQIRRVAQNGLRIILIVLRNLYSFFYCYFYILVYDLFGNSFS